MKYIYIILVLILAAMAGAWTFDARSSTDLRGKGVVQFDSARTTGSVIAAAIKADSSIVGDLITARDSVYEVGGQTLEFGGEAGYLSTNYLRVSNDLLVTGGMQVVTSITAYPATTPTISGFSTVSCGFADVDSANIGGGATITKVDTSAAGDSTKIDFLNGNKIMHPGTEVKP